MALIKTTEIRDDKIFITYDEIERYIIEEARETGKPKWKLSLMTGKSSIHFAIRMAYEYFWEITEAEERIFEIMSSPKKLIVKGEE